MSKTQVAPWVQDLVEEVSGKSKLAIGKTLMHPDGYKVKIISGQFWGEYGLSNFWYWRKVLKNNKLSKKVYCGYGW